MSSQAPTFNYFSGESDPVQHIRHFQDKMVIYSYNNPLICVTFSVQPEKCGFVLILLPAVALSPQL